jgi:TIR domain
MRDFFISYNQADKAWAEWIAWQIESAGQTVAIQAWDFRPGGNFVLDMQQAIEQADRTLLVLSPDFLKSRFTAPEWAAAFAQDPTGQQRRLVGVRVRDCQPTGLLAQIVYIDLLPAKDREAARQLLLDGLKRERAKPASEPDMPAIEGATHPANPPAAQAPEPPWPPALELAAQVAGSVLWRGLRIGSLILVVALAVVWLLSSVLPRWAQAQPATLYVTGLAWGVVAALVIEAVLRLWRRHRVRQDGATP